MSDITVRIAEEEPISVEFVEARIKPEQEKSVTPAYSAQTVLPDVGMTLGKVNVSAIPDPTDVKEIVSNGDHDVRRYGTARVAVPQGVFPSGVLPINNNGSYDVTDKEGVLVNVQELVHGQMMDIFPVDVVYSGEGGTLAYTDFMRALSMAAAEQLGISEDYCCSVGFSALDPIPDGGFLQATMCFTRYTSYRMIGYYKNGDLIVREQQQYVQNLKRSVLTNSRWRVFCFVED